MQLRCNTTESRDARARLLPSILREAAQAAPRSGIVCNDRFTSYQEIERRSDRLADALIEKGVCPGDRVLTALPNCVEFVIASFAIWKARGILALADRRIRRHQLMQRINDARPVAIVVDNDLAEEIAGLGVFSCLKAMFVHGATCAPSHPTQTDIESLDAVLNRNYSKPRLPPGASSEDVVSISYTSGSSGHPKGVMHTHDSWLAGADFTRSYHRISAEDSMAVSLPLHHGLAFRQILAHVLGLGTLNITSDIYQMLKQLDKHRATSLLLVPAACTILVDHFAELLASADRFLRYVEVGSAAMSREVLQKMQQLLPTTAIHLPYGLTEARVGFLNQGLDQQMNRIATLAAGLELQVVDEDGRPVKNGEKGEILVRSRGLMKGYWGHPDPEHEATIRRIGFRTGDQGHVCIDGEVHLLGRVDDIVKVGGRKVSPIEVETILNQHSAVAESAVVSTSDERSVLEDELQAFVVSDGGAPLQDSELLAHCRQHLEEYKIPSRFHYVHSLPKSPVGKILRRSLATAEA